DGDGRVSRQFELLTGDRRAEALGSRIEDRVAELIQVIGVWVGGQLRQLDRLLLAGLELENPTGKNGGLVLARRDVERQNDGRDAPGRIGRARPVCHLERDRRRAEVALSA